MSPSPAAPRIASVTLADHVGIRVPERAALGGNRDAAEDQRPALRPADAGRSRCPPRPVRAAPATTVFVQSASAIGQILRRRDLDVGRLRLRRCARVPGALGERRLVGRLDAGVAERQRVAQHVAAKRLRRLREIDRLARQRLRTNVSGTRAVRPCRARCAGPVASPCRAPAAPRAPRRTSAAAAIVREIRSALANGRAASWITTTSARASTARNAFATESCRRAPPATIRSALAIVRQIRRRVGDETRPAAPRRSRRSSGCARKTATLRSRRNGRRPSATASGRAPPSRGRGRRPR